MSGRNPTYEAEIAPRDDVPPETICSYYRDDIKKDCDVFTDDPNIGIKSRVWHFEVPVAPVTLTARSRDFLNKLKSRCSTHVTLLCGEYMGFQQERFEGINRDLGVLLQLPRSRATRALDMAKDENAEVKADRLQKEHLKSLVKRLKVKGEEYLEAVEASWLRYDHGNYEYKLQYYKDVGLLMQLPNDQSREILHILLGMVSDGKIVKSKDWDNFGFSLAWRIIYDIEAPVEAPVEASGPHVQDMPAPPQPDADKKRKVPPDDELEESQPSLKRARKGGCIPRAGEWKCAKCGWWSNLEFCTKKNRHQQSVCSGRRGGTQG